MNANCEIHCADCLEYMRAMSDDSVDLIFSSPPYEQARLYLEDGKDLGIARDTEAWVAWMVDIAKESLRVCKGLVAFVVEGQTKKYRYSCAPALLMADLHRSGVHLRKPPIYKRYGIPGSGGKDWLRNDWEWILCATNGGKLPWSDNTVMGHTPKFPPGGEMSYRNQHGQRRNARHRKQRVSKRPNGTQELQAYNPPEKSNPGNIIDCGAAGGGRLGSTLAHLNEAPFPEQLAEFFIRSFCKPDGIVLDPFSGSGTTAAVALAHGRRAIAIDLRDSQVELTRRRIDEVTPLSLLEE